MKIKLGCIKLLIGVGKISETFHIIPNPVVLFDKNDEYFEFLLGISFGFWALVINIGFIRRAVLAMKTKKI
jgi:hypothetical protein